MTFLLILLIFGLSNALEDCQTPTNQPGKCVLINHCPHLFSSIIHILQNRTSNSKDLIQKSHCGLESTFFPKVCCPTEAVKFFGENGAISHNQHSTECGLHLPNGPSDPWLALIEYENSIGERSFLCGGVLINKRYVLAAAHCVKGPNIPQNMKLLNIHLGKFNSDASNSELIIPVDGSTVHENYDPDDPNQYNDIALIRLKNKVSFKEEFTRPICIPMNNNNKNFVGKKLQLTGYAKFENSAKKRDGIATIWNNSECHLVYSRSEVKLGESQICAGGKKLPYQQFLRIDLGGVLMHVTQGNTYSAVGILSLEPSCCDKENYPKVYTRVDSYTSWIISNLKP